MKFETALGVMRDGYWVYRQAWHKLQCLGLDPDTSGKPQFYLDRLPSKSNMRSHWEPNHEDLLAENWETL